MLMAFRSQRYHLSRGRAKNRVETRGERRVAERRNENCSDCVCTVVGKRRVAVVLGCTLCEDSAADIAHPEYFMGRVWNKIKFATRQSLPSLSLTLSLFRLKKSSTFLSLLLLGFLLALLEAEWNNSVFCLVETLIVFLPVD